MGPTQRKITIGLWVAALVAIVGIVAGKVLMQRQAATTATEPVAGHHEVQLVDLFPVPSITLTDQDGNSFSTDSLHGKVWIADFVFTSCGSICPILSNQMSKLQQMTPASVNFVSFSVDPKTDTPAVLRAYGTRNGADFSRWHFLTGSVEQMTDAAVKMKVATGTGNLLSHSDRFMLVNSKGVVVGVYSGLQADDLKQIAKDATKLVSDGSADSQTASAGKAG